jgi:hypothetical protein
VAGATGTVKDTFVATQFLSVRETALDRKSDPRRRMQETPKGKGTHRVVGRITQQTNAATVKPISSASETT